MNEPKGIISFISAYEEKGSTFYWILEDGHTVAGPTSLEDLKSISKALVGFLDSVISQS